MMASMAEVRAGMVSIARTSRFIAGHPLASKRPLAALRRYVWWRFASRRQRVVDYAWIGGSRLRIKRGMAGATGNIYCGLHEFADMALVLHLLRPGDLFVDVGANVGSYTVLASAVCAARSIAVEPDPETSLHLLANVGLNRVGGRVEVVLSALGAYEGRALLTVGLDTMNRVATAAVPGARDVAMHRLDDVLGRRKPRLIKIDVEGYEAEVVAGASRSLSETFLLAVLTEGCGPNVRGPLEARGFRRYSYDPFKREIRPFAGEARGQHNALFIRDVETVRELVASAPRRLVAGIAL